MRWAVLLPLAAVVLGWLAGRRPLRVAARVSVPLHVTPIHCADCDARSVLTTHGRCARCGSEAVWLVAPSALAYGPGSRLVH